MEGFELELRLVVELGGVEEDEEVVGPWGFCGVEVEILSFCVFVFEEKFWVFCVFDFEFFFGVKFCF